MNRNSTVKCVKILEKNRQTPNKRGLKANKKGRQMIPSGRCEMQKVTVMKDI